MTLSVVSFVVVAAFLGHAAAHHMNEEVYEKMCDKNTTFREGLIKCFKEMPEKDQMTLKFCGSVLGNKTIEDFETLVDETCNNGKYALKVVQCMDKVGHEIHHISNGTHHHDEDDDHHDDDHHDDHHHHDPHFDFGHGVYNEECFRSLYESYGISTSKED